MRWRCFCESDQPEDTCEEPPSTPCTDRAVWADFIGTPARRPATELLGLRSRSIWPWAGWTAWTRRQLPCGMAKQNPPKTSCLAFSRFIHYLWLGFPYGRCKREDLADLAIADWARRRGWISSIHWTKSPKARFLSRRAGIRGWGTVLL